MCACSAKPLPLTLRILHPHCCWRSQIYRSAMQSPARHVQCRGATTRTAPCLWLFDDAPRLLSMVGAVLQARSCFEACGYAGGHLCEECGSCQGALAAPDSVQLPGNLHPQCPQSRRTVQSSPLRAPFDFLLHAALVNEHGSLDVCALKLKLRMAYNVNAWSGGIQEQRMPKSGFIYVHDGTSASHALLGPKLMLRLYASYAKFMCCA